jgi:hypothetical protein
VLPPASATAPVQIPTTHANTEPLGIFRAAGGKGGVVLQLAPFTTVTVLKSERGWAHIAQDGKPLGYAPEAKLNRLASSRAPEPDSATHAPRTLPS